MFIECILVSLGVPKIKDYISSSQLHRQNETCVLLNTGPENNKNSLLCPFFVLKDRIWISLFSVLNDYLFLTGNLHCAIAALTET